MGDLDGQAFPLGSGEVTFRLLGRGQSADIAAGPFAAYYVARAPNISVSEASVTVTVYDEIASKSGACPSTQRRSESKEPTLTASTRRRGVQ